MHPCYHIPELVVKGILNTLPFGKLHNKVSRTGKERKAPICPIYDCQPYSAWEKGSIERHRYRPLRLPAQIHRRLQASPRALKQTCHLFPQKESPNLCIFSQVFPNASRKSIDILEYAHDIDGVKYPVGALHNPTNRDGRLGWNYVAFSDEHLRVDHVYVWNPATDKFEQVADPGEERKDHIHVWTGARQSYDRVDLAYVGSGTGGNNEGRGAYSSGVRRRRWYLFALLFSVARQGASVFAANI